MSPEKSVIDQAMDQLNKAKHVAVFVQGDLTGDTLCAALALTVRLRKDNKTVSLKVFGQLPDNLNFMPYFDLLKGQQDQGGILVLNVSKANKVLDEFWYEEKDGGVKIFISPKKGHLFKKSDVSIDVEPSTVKTDLIVTIGLHSPENLGEAYARQASLFFDTPSINIDNQAGNTMYGKINLVNLMAASLSEMVFSLVEQLPGGEDAEIATILFTGIIRRTESFQNVKTTPKAFFTASKLLSWGADKEKVVRSLYKTRTFGHLKLWGRALARLNFEPQVGLVCSMLKKSDLEKYRANDSDVQSVFNELIGVLSDAKLVLLIVETAETAADAKLYSRLPNNLEELSIELGGTMLNRHTMDFKLEGEPLESLQERAKNKITNWLKVSQTL